MRGGWGTRRRSETHRKAGSSDSLRRSLRSVQECLFAKPAAFRGFLIRHQCSIWTVNGASGRKPVTSYRKELWFGSRGTDLRGSMQRRQLEEFAIPAAAQSPAEPIGSAMVTAYFGFRRRSARLIPQACRSPDRRGRPGFGYFGSSAFDRNLRAVLQGGRLTRNKLG